MIAGKPRIVCQGAVYYANGARVHSSDAWVQVTGVINGKHVVIMLPVEMGCFKFVLTPEDEMDPRNLFCLSYGIGDGRHHDSLVACGDQYVRLIL